jgi:hypothetical protein
MVWRACAFPSPSGDSLHTATSSGSEGRSPLRKFPSPSGDSLHTAKRSPNATRGECPCFHRPQAILFILPLSSREHEKSMPCDTIFAYLDFSTAPCSSQNNEVLENVVLTSHAPSNPRSLLFSLGEKSFLALVPRAGAVMQGQTRAHDACIMLIGILLLASHALKTADIFYQLLDIFVVICVGILNVPSLALNPVYSRS